MGFAPAALYLNCWWGADGRRLCQREIWSSRVWCVGSARDGASFAGFISLRSGRTPRPLSPIACAPTWPLSARAHRAGLIETRIGASATADRHRLLANAACPHAAESGQEARDSVACARHDARSWRSSLLLSPRQVNGGIPLSTGTRERSCRAWRAGVAATFRAPRCEWAERQGRCTRDGLSGRGALSNYARRKPANGAPHCARCRSTLGTPTFPAPTAGVFNSWVANHQKAPRERHPSRGRRTCRSVRKR